MILSCMHTQSGVSDQLCLSTSVSNNYDVIYVCHTKEATKHIPTLLPGVAVDRSNLWSSCWRLHCYDNWGESVAPPYRLGLVITYNYYHVCMVWDLWFLQVINKPHQNYYVYYCTCTHHQYCVVANNASLLYWSQLSPVYVSLQLAPETHSLYIYYVLYITLQQANLCTMSIARVLQETTVTTPAL